MTAPVSAIVGAPFSFTVSALDPFNNIDTAYGGSVLFSSTDGSAVLPGASSLTSGVGNFSATLHTAGTKTISTAESVTSSIQGTSNNIAVAQAGTSVGLVTSVPIAGLGQNITFTATVSILAPSLSTVNRGTVTFLDGVNPIGSVTLTNLTGNVAMFSTTRA